MKKQAKQHTTKKTHKFILFWQRENWLHKTLLDKILDISLTILVGVVIVCCILLFMPKRDSNNNTRVAPSSISLQSSKAEKKTSQVHSKQTITDKNADNESSSINNALSDKSISQNNYSDTATNSSTLRQKGHGEVSDGMNATYRMAIQAGIVKGDYSEEDIHNFYNNVQESPMDNNGNGSFTYNGQTVYVQKSHQGNPDGILQNGQTYTDPDRYTVYTEQQ